MNRIECKTRIKNFVQNKCMSKSTLELVATEKKKKKKHHKGCVASKHHVFDKIMDQAQLIFLITMKHGKVFLNTS